MNVLFINNKKKSCGVYQYGLRLFNILKKSKNIDFDYNEIDNFNSYNNLLNDSTTSAIIYNYHPGTMKWLCGINIQKNKDCKNICIYHESVGDELYFFDIKLNINPLFSNNNQDFGIPRPIFEDIDYLDSYVPSCKSITDFINYSDKKIPIFGSFGFGFDTKGFHKLINLINNNLQQAIIKIVIPMENNSPYHLEYIQYCKNIKVNPEIKILFSHKFFTNDDILKFLHTNDMNIFLYDYNKIKHISNDKIGISSVIDYAISVKKPLGISNSLMFNHIYDDKICLYKTSINDCMRNSVNYCSKFLNDYNHCNLIKTFENIIL